jgi:4-hydroxythreonine-4-phosphate dehydrogenase
VKTGLAPLAVTMGEPAGIGGEIVLKAWLRRAAEDLPPFFLIDDPARLEALAQTLDLPARVVAIARPGDAAAAFGEALPVVPLTTALDATPGVPKAANAAAVIESIRKAAAFAQSGAAAGLVTNPIQKAALYAADFPFPGHTEFLASLAGKDAQAVMMLAIEGLRVVPATVHVPLAAVPARLTTADLRRLGRITARALADDFGIAEPRLAVAALNPHAGENGTIGEEEKTIIAPAVAALRDDGLAVFGPAPADTLFHPAARSRYDAVLCMYHDQALIPLKTLDFEGGVNVTLNLPFVRTSPDHGTALDIAGRGLANPASLMAALRMAAAIAAMRARRAAR